MEEMNADRNFQTPPPATSIEDCAVVAEPLPTFRGPGIWGASGWMVLFLVVQLVASLVVLIGMAGVFLWSNDLDAMTAEELQMKLGEIIDDPAYMVGLIGGTLALSAIVNSLLVWWRLGRAGRATLGLQRLPLSQGACIALMVLPLSLIGSKLYMVGDAYWQEIMQQLPEGFDLSSLKSMDTISLMANELSLPWMIVLFALLPAVSEELMFRGFIGRGLTERWGRVAGVVLTTGFFATMHGYPPHMLALVPLSIMIHDVYLVTKSFWAPVLMHFTNNALAVIVLSLHVEDPVFNANNDVAISPAMLFASVSCVLALAALIRALQRSPALHTASVSGDLSDLDHTHQIAAMQNHVALQLDALTHTAVQHLRVKRLLALATIAVMLFGIACFNVGAV